MYKMLLLLTLVSCKSCRSPKEYLQERDRPEPITCIVTGKSQQTCTDGSGFVWTCGNTPGVPAECIMTGKLPAEAP